MGVLLVPELRERRCTAGSEISSCLEDAQIDALLEVMDGARNSEGAQLYAPFAWDAGLGSTGWLVWKTGFRDGPLARNVLLGAGSLAAVFSTPPVAVLQDDQAYLDWLLDYDFDEGPARIYAVAAPYETSAWQDVGIRSTVLDAFRARGGKMIVPHGVADPAFSVLDTIDWWEDLNERSSGSAADFVRVFPVPGMAHCASGPSNDRFDSLAALERWVMEDAAPEAIRAVAGTETPWPGRTMPLCPWPKTARTRANGTTSCESP